MGNNRGSTMVEVLAGVTILVIIIVECMVHLVGISGELVKKSRDTQEDLRVLNEEMYKKDANFKLISGTDIILTLDTEKTDTKNLAKAASIKLDADIYRYYSDKAELAIFRIIGR